ncbi:hypothetical protein M1555_02655 [Patescibacteria group bacterium]|nr:hypothetical protein [Patescibacteria group bacterium]
MLWAGIRPMAGTGRRVLIAMKNMKVLLGVLVVLLVITGGVVWNVLSKPKTAAPQAVQTRQTETQAEPSVDASVTVALTKSTAKANTVELAVNGLSGKYTSIAYELSYNSNGLIKGVNSGSKPLDVAGKDTLTREVYLGTCSRNDCTPDTGVSTVTVALEFTDVQGKKSQFSKDFAI